jgi:hypothetical protein
LKIPNKSERTGVLTDIIDVSDENITIFLYVFEEIQIPNGSISVDILKKFIGEFVGISRIDSDYSVRLVKKRNKKRK